VSAELELSADVRERLTELRKLSEKAQAGDKTARRELRKAVRSSSGEVINRASDLAKMGRRVLIKAAATNNPLLEEALPARLDLMREEIAGENPTPLEVLLTEQVVSLWMLLQLHEVLHSAQYRRGSEHQVSPSFMLQMVKLQESAHRRFLASVQTLARVRKLQVNTPGIQVNTQINLTERQDP
jgi:hypothetical protein